MKNHEDQAAPGSRAGDVRAAFWEKACPGRPHDSETARALWHTLMQEPVGVALADRDGLPPARLAMSLGRLCQSSSRMPTMRLLVGARQRAVHHLFSKDAPAGKMVAYQIATSRVLSLSRDEITAMWGAWDSMSAAGEGSALAGKDGSMTLGAAREAAAGIRKARQADFYRVQPDADAILRQVEWVIRRRRARQRAEAKRTRPGTTKP